MFWGELAERASYYGMKGLLTLFLVSAYAYSEGKAASLTQYFGAACYLMPLAGGFLADRYIGKYWTIVIFSIPYVCGHLVLGGFIGETYLYSALALLALGAGAIKPNASTLMGSIYEKAGKEHLLTEAFSYYYAAINIGAGLSSWLLPIIQHHYEVINTPTMGATAAATYGYRIALIYPTILMAVALGAFAAGKVFYPQERIVREEKSVEQKIEERDTLLRISGIFFLIAVFWFVYDQQASTWIVFANSHMDLWLRPFNFYILPNQLQAINAWLIVGMTPLFTWWWDYLARRRGGLLVPATKKMMTGFIIVIGCMGTMAVAGFLSERGPVSVWYFIIATIVITMSELCISVVGLEFAFTQASERTKSTVTAAFLFMVFLGDGVAGIFVDKWYDALPKGVFFAIQTGIMVVAAVLFKLVARRFEQETLRPEDLGTIAETDAQIDIGRP